MALDPQVVPIKLDKLDTKHDERWIMPGDLVLSQNLRYDRWPRLLKRNGYQQLSAAAGGSELANFKTQLLLGTGSEAFGYSASGLVDKGALEAFSISAKAVRRDANLQTTQDNAIHPFGITVYTWETTASGIGAQYSVVDNTNGQTIVSAISLGATAIKPKALVLGIYVIVLFIDTSTNNLRFIAIPAANPTNPTTVANLATDANASNIYDAAVLMGAGGSLVFAYHNAIGGTTSVSVRLLTTGIVVSSATLPNTGTDVPTNCLGVFIDTGGNVWISYWQGTS